MEKKVHILEVECNKCGTTFQHIFVATDLFKPHMFNELDMKCPKCGQKGFDVVHLAGKQTLEEWQQSHPGMNIKDLPDHSYLETGEEQ